MKADPAVPERQAGDASPRTPGPDARDRPAPARRALYYVVFNDGWDRVAGNAINQAARPVAPGEAQRAVGKYLDYLAHSMQSFARHHPDGAIPVRVWLVELSRDGMDAEGLRAAMDARRPGVPFDVTVLGHRHVAEFLDEARRMPDRFYRSPNRLHEAVNFHILDRSREELLAVVDPDVTFLQDGALDGLFDRLQKARGKWAAGFVETGRRRPVPGGFVQMRDRLHSVVALFKVGPMRRHVAFAPFLRATGLEARLAGVTDAEAAAYYRLHRTLDTFSLLTEMLRTGHGRDRLLDLGRRLPRFVEGQLLTLVSEPVIHCKIGRAHV